MKPWLIIYSWAGGVACLVMGLSMLWGDQPSRTLPMGAMGWGIGTLVGFGAVGKVPVEIKFEGPLLTLRKRDALLLVLHVLRATFWAFLGVDRR